MSGELDLGSLGAVFAAFGDVFLAMLQPYWADRVGARGGEDILVGVG